MPKELKSEDEFQKLLEAATEVRVSKKGEQAKVKLRTEGTLYTYKTTADAADSLVKGLKIPVVEL